MAKQKTKQQLIQENEILEAKLKALQKQMTSDIFKFNWKSYRGFPLTAEQKEALKDQVQQIVSHQGPISISYGGRETQVYDLEYFYDHPCPGINLVLIDYSLTEEDGFIIHEFWKAIEV